MNDFGSITSADSKRVAGLFHHESLSQEGVLFGPFQQKTDRTPAVRFVCLAARKLLTL
jgi:hypothetical protein